MSEKTVYKEWHNEHMGITRRMHMPVEIQHLDKTVTTHTGEELEGFWMANNYATGPKWVQFYLRGDALQALEWAQEDAVEAGGCILMTDAYRSWDEQMRAYKGKKGVSGIAVHPSKSKHPLGVAIDVTPHDMTQEQLERILGGYDWRRTIPHEVWHFEFQG